MDLRFLHARVTPGVPVRPINVFELSGFPRWETVASNVLGYFLDPNERHQLGPVFVDALLSLVEGSPFLGPPGSRPVALESYALSGSTEWTVATEQSTPDGKRIDIFLTNAVLGAAIIIENKMDAVVNNPFESYGLYALQAYPRTLAVVLAPTRRLALGRGTEPWISASITYDELFDMVQEPMARASDFDARSADLLQQFIENTSERRTAVDEAADLATLTAFREAVANEQESFVEFFGLLDRLNMVLKARANRLKEAIGARLGSSGIVADDVFVVAGVDHGWGRREGLVAVVYLGFQFASGRGIELILGFLPQRPTTQLHVKAYGDRRKPNVCLPDYDHIPLGVEYETPDDVVAERFVRIVEQLAPR